MKQFPGCLGLPFWMMATLVGNLLPLGAAEVRQDPARNPEPVIPAKSRVVISENPELVRRFQVNTARIPETFNKSLLALTRKSSIPQAWSQFVSPDDVVGIKIVTAGGAVMSSHRSLIDAIVAGLQSAGIKPNNIIVWDRYEDQMISAGYIPMESTNEWQCLSVQPGAGFDPKKNYFNEVVGQLIWGDHDFVGRSDTPHIPVEDLLKREPKKTGEEEKKKETPKQISNRSYYTTILTKKITKLINVPVMSDHQRLGLNGCIASLALASVDNQRRFQTPADFSGLAIAEIYADDVIRKKTVLHVMDGLIAQFAGGPEFVPNYTESPGILILSRDPVAIDSLALERIEAWRRERKVVPVGDAANHIIQAARSGLGNIDRDLIEVVVVR